MNCSHSTSKLYLYVANELPEQECLDLEKHLGQCEECRQELEDYQQVVQTYRALPSASTSGLSPDAMLSRIKQTFYERQHAWKFSPTIWVPVTAALILLGIIFLVPRIIRQHPSQLNNEFPELVDVFEDPSFFAKEPEKWDIQQSAIRFSPREEKTMLLANKIASLRRSETVSLLDPGNDRRIQQIEQHIHTLSTYEEFPAYLPANSIFRRTVL